MPNVISLDIHNENGKRSFVGVAICDGMYESCLHFPDDYTNIDIFELILDRAKDYDAEILFDENGFGKALEDYLLATKKGVYRTLKLSDMKAIPQILKKAQDSLLELAIDSSFDYGSKIEFLKLSEELNNLEIKIGTNGNFGLNKADENIGTSRALCYLQYYYKFVVNNSL